MPVEKYVNELKPVFLEVFATTVLSAPDRVPDDVFTAYRPLLRTLRRKDFASLVPKLARCVGDGAADHWSGWVGGSMGAVDDP